MHDEARACIDAGDESNAKVKLFRMLDEAIDKIIPHDPFNPDRALSGPLSNVFRVKKGKLRICYIASSEHRQILILYISETLRKAGDRADPYSLFTRMVMSWRFDELFAHLGVKVPPTARWIAASRPDFKLRHCQLQVAPRPVVGYGVCGVYMGGMGYMVCVGCARCRMREADKDPHVPHSARGSGWSASSGGGRPYPPNRALSNMRTVDVRGTGVRRRP